MTNRSSRRAPLALCVVLVLLAAVGSAAAGVLDARLQGLLDAAGAHDEIAVVVRLADGVGPVLDKSLRPGGPGARRELVRRLRTRAATAEEPVRRLLERRGVTEVTSLWGIGALALTATPEVVREVAATVGVARVSYDERVTAPLTPKAETSEPDEWNLDMIRAPELWSRGQTGGGVLVAVLDTGVDALHPDLADRWRGLDGGWFDPYGEHAEPYDASGHGTQVAGLVLGGDAGGSPIGVAPGARWMAARVFDDEGVGTLSRIHEALQWVLDPDGDPETDDAPDVVNNSWGFEDRPGECSEEFSADIQVLGAAGIAVVFSAGNTGPAPSSSVSPGNNPGAFPVGASDGGREVVEASARGPSACGGAFPAAVAPGQGLRTSDKTFDGVFPDSYSVVSGTSFAAAQASGAMALLLGAHPEATVDQLEQALTQSGDDIEDEGPDDDSGHGLIDVAAAEETLAKLLANPAAATIYGDETSFLAAAAGLALAAEGFEDDATWGGTRNPAGLAQVSASGVTWVSNHSGNEISTSGGAARTGAWGMYSNPHGDQTVPGASDPITDGFVGTSSETLTAVGGWFRGTAGGKVAVILDGDVAQRIELGPVDAQFRFYGVIDRAGFHSFEFRELEGTLQDQKLIFVDDVTVGRAPVAGNDPPSGAIVEPGADVTVPVGQPVAFRGTATDPDGDAVTVLWDFGDGATSAALEPGSHTYQAAGVYAVTLTATDARGLSDPSPETRTIRVLDQWPRTDGVVAGVAAVRGLRGSDWHTDLWLHNGSQSPAQVELYYAGAGAPLSTPVVRSLAADSTSALPDVVGGTFGRSGSGAVFWRVVAGDPAAVLVTANTYNRLDDVRRYGQEVPGVTWSGAAPAGEAVVAPALAGPFRSNLGFATDDACTQVTVRGRDRSGALQVERTLDVAPLSWVQLDSLFRRAFPALLADPDGATAADSLHTFEVTGVDGKVVAYTSIVDNSSNDGSYMLARRWDSALGTVWLPGAALTSGFGASRWRSDVMAVGPGTGAVADLTFYPTGRDNGAGGRSRQLALAADEASLTSNVLSSLFQARAPAVGSVTGAGGALLWMRTYTEGSDQGGAFTYGQAIPAFAPEDAVAPGEEGRAFGFTVDARTRSNLILQNVLTDGSGALLGVGVRVDLIDSQGVVLYQHSYQLRPGEYLQHNSFMADYGIGEISTGVLRVVLTDVPASAAGGGVVAMVSEVNGADLQGTNDGRLIPAMIPGRPRAQ